MRSVKGKTQTVCAEGIPKSAAAHGDFALDEEFVAVGGCEADPFVHLLVLICLMLHSGK